MKRGSSRLATIGGGGEDRSEPFFWWGSRPGRRPVATLEQLIELGMLAPSAARLLLDLIDEGTSIFVVSQAAGAGKSTLLAALLAECDTSRKTLYLRGSYETFDFLKTADPLTHRLAVNELSPHLPIYLWGKPVTRFLSTSKAGYQLLATAHAASVAGFVQSLITPPLDIDWEVASLPKAVTVLAECHRPGIALSCVQEITSVSRGNWPGRFQLSTLYQKNAVRDSASSGRDTCPDQRLDGS
ncbi:hypothetical protein BH23CHL5_BH23CHL5_17930 [soil metagenome]